MSNEKQNKPTSFVAYHYSDKVLDNAVDLMRTAHEHVEIMRKLSLDYLKVSKENEKLVLDLQDKKKTISSLEEEIKLMQSNVIDKDVLFEEVREASLNSIMDDFKSGGEISDYILEILYPKLCEENKTLKETNKNLLEISKGYQEELAQQSNYIGELKEYIEDSVHDLQYYKEKYSKIKAKVNTIYGNSQILGDISLEETSNLKKENEKLKMDKSQLNLRVHYLEERICDNSLKSSEENQILIEENKKLKQEVKSAQEFAIQTRVYHVEENEKLKQKIHEAFNRLTLYVIDRRTSSVISSHIIKAMNILE
jgi:hypothetical protein